MKRLHTLLAVASAAFFIVSAHAQNAGTVTNNAFAIGQGAGKTGYKSVLCTAGQLPVGQAAAPICQTLTGDASLSSGGALTLAAVNSNVGSFGSATQCATFTVNGKGLITAASQATCTPGIGSVTGLGTGVAAALAVNVGSAGAPVLFNGAGGTPSSMVGTNITSLNASNLASGTVAAARGGAGTINGVLAGNGSGVVSQGTCAGLSGVAASCATDATNASNINSGTLPAARLGLGQLTNSLGANVALNNTGTYFDGPTIAQGPTGTWWASGTVTAVDTAGAANIQCKLWDGTTIIDSGQASVASINANVSFALSGFIVNPAGNIRISCKDAGSTSGVMLFNGSGNSKDSTVSAFRIN